MAEGVKKISGISIASAGQIIVRGLGDRYSTTTLNGLPIASPNPDNKLIQLDIFPTSTVKNITVSKVYEANTFADYSGASSTYHSIQAANSTRWARTCTAWTTKGLSSEHQS